MSFSQGNSACPRNPASSTSPTFIAVPMMMPMTTMQMQVQHPPRFLPTAPSQPLQLQMRPMQPLMQSSQPGPAPVLQTPGIQAVSDQSTVAPKAQNGPHERSESTSQTTESAMDDDDLESISELSTESRRYSSTLLPSAHHFCVCFLVKTEKSKTGATLRSGLGQFPTVLRCVRWSGPSSSSTLA